MNKCNHYVSLKRSEKTGKLKTLKQSEKTGELRQFNSPTRLTIERKFGVRGAELSHFEEFIALILSSLWDIDSHYEKIRQHGGGRFLKLIEPLLGFNDPKKHKLAVKSINIETLKAKVTQLIIRLERSYMRRSQMKVFGELV